MGNNKSMIIKNICKQFDKNVYVLKDININISSGCFLSIIGISGCGKSTLLNAIANLCQIDSGEIIFEKEDINIGYIFQESRLMPWLTVENNILFGIKLKNKNEINKKIDDYLKLTNLMASRKKYPEQLSGGMKQRVSIARTLIIEPDVLLLDEPFSALDAFTKTRLQNELLDWWYKNKKTIIFVTHDIEEALLLSNRIIVMNSGEVIDDLQINFDYPRRIDDQQLLELRKYLTKKLINY